MKSDNVLLLLLLLETKLNFFGIFFYKLEIFKKYKNY